MHLCSAVTAVINLSRMWRLCLTSDNILSPTVTRCRICDWTLFTHNMIPSGVSSCFINRLGAACYHGYFKGIRLFRVRRNRSRLPAKHSAVGCFTFFPPLIAFLSSHFSPTWTKVQLLKSACSLVGWSDTKKSWIIDTCIRLKDHGYMHHAYLYTCIIHTCVRIKDDIYMHRG